MRRWKTKSRRSERPLFNILIKTEDGNFINWRHVINVKPRNNQVVAEHVDGQKFEYIVLYSSNNPDKLERWTKAYRQSLGQARTGKKHIIEVSID